MPAFNEIQTSSKVMSYPQLLVSGAAKRHTHYAVAWCSDGEVGARDERNIEALSTRLGGELYSFGGKEVYDAAKDVEGCNLGPVGAQFSKRLVLAVFTL